MQIETSPAVQKIMDSASDREIQNQIFLTLRKTEARLEDCRKSLATLRGIAVAYLIISIIAGIIIAAALAE